MKILSFKKEILNHYNFSFYLFCFGLFFLPSALPLSILLFLICNTCNSFKEKNNLFSNKLSRYFLIGGFLQIISVLVQTFFQINKLQDSYDISLSWIGLFNWIPLFWCFACFKTFLKTSERRRICGIFLISGTFPVLVTGFGQAIFDWDGPFSILNGLIIWYQRPIESITGLTGLFNNPNYAGAWLSIILPFCLATLINSKRDFLKLIFNFLFSISITIATILTNSRSAWIGIFIGVLITYGRESYKYLIRILIILSLAISSAIYPILGSDIQKLLTNLIPQNIIFEFSNFQISRIDIWKSAINAILNNPIFGSGASSFTSIYQLETGLWKGHSHNLFLELIVSYGIPAGIIIMLTMLSIAYKATHLLFNQRLKISFYDRSWIASLIIFFTTQLVDVQYFDGRISFIGWILLSGCSNIITDYSEKKMLSNL